MRGVLSSGASAGRRFVHYIVLLFCMSVTANDAFADAAHDGIEFVRELGRKGMEVLQDRNLSYAEKEQRFKKLYDAHFNAEKITQSIVGVPWRSATSKERLQLRNLVGTYIPRLLVTRLGNFLEMKPESYFEVTLSYVQPGGGDIVVFSSLVNSADSTSQNIKWLLERHGESYKIRDVFIAGISLVIHEREEFSSDFVKFGETIEGLLRAVSQKIANLASR